MKEYKFNLNQLFVEKFFQPIRSKVDVIQVLLETIKYMILNPSIKKSDIQGKIILKIEKMSRLFFFTENKFFSISFPFSVGYKNETYSFSSKHIKNIDAKLIEQIISIIECDDFNTNCSLDFVEPICDFDDEYCDESFWSFLREMLLMEDGYIRYDVDIENYNKFKNIGEADKHPKHHYDIFYSNQSTFKIGLNSAVIDDEFIDFLNKNTNCKYLI